MRINVRLSGELATLVGKHRFSMIVTDGATIADLLDLLREEYPESVSRLDTAVPIISGKHVAQSEQLADGQEVAFLLPIAGG
jgi:molybdopterin synthase sulfur carrier subunit